VAAAPPPVLATLPADGAPADGAHAPFGFRDKVHFVCTPGDHGSGIALGHYAAGGGSIVRVEECPVHADEGNRIAWLAREACEEAGVPAATPDGARGLLRHVVVRVARASGQSLVTLVATNARDPRLRRAVARLSAAAGAPDGIHVNQLEGPSRWLFGPQTRRAHGRALVREDVAGVSFLIGPTAFFQTNVRAAEVLVRLVLQAIPVEADVLDLYAGAGLFALPLARRGHRVTALEEHPGAVEAARVSLRLNRLADTACRFVRTRVEEGLPRVPQPRAGRVRAVVLDPPRAGCSPRTLVGLVRHVRPDVIVYVSCEPGALARDLALVLGHGRREGLEYAMDPVQPVDMFPHTPHVEAVAVLRRPGRTRHREQGENQDGDAVARRARHGGNPPP
jgi:23S rRNA (uracil1939-C5)-methyltransferase